jgi:hypothetical protein
MLCCLITTAGHHGQLLQRGSATLVCIPPYGLREHRARIVGFVSWLCGALGAAQAKAVAGCGVNFAAWVDRLLCLWCRDAMTIGEVTCGSFGTHYTVQGSATAIHVCSLQSLALATVGLL